MFTTWICVTPHWVDTSLVSLAVDKAPLWKRAIIEKARP